MHYSGILVASAPTHLEEVERCLLEMDGIEVHYSYPELGRLVVVQETESVEEQEDGLRAIQRLPHVLYAELVYHRFDEPKEEP